MYVYTMTAVVLIIIFSAFICMSERQPWPWTLHRCTWCRYLGMTIYVCTCVCRNSWLFKNKCTGVYSHVCWSGFDGFCCTAGVQPHHQPACRRQLSHFVATRTANCTLHWQFYVGKGRCHIFLCLPCGNCLLLGLQVARIFATYGILRACLRIVCCVHMYVYVCICFYIHMCVAVVFSLTSLQFRTLDDISYWQPLRTPKCQPLRRISPLPGECVGL